MDLASFIETNSDSIVTGADIAIARRHLQNYEGSIPGVISARLETLLRLATRSIRERRVDGIEKYMEKITVERFNAGFDLSEVQSAINVLEEAIWKLIMYERSPAEQIEELGLIGTVFGAAKDTLARTYASLASARVVVTMNGSVTSDGP